MFELRLKLCKSAFSPKELIRNVCDNYQTEYEWKIGHFVDSLVTLPELLGRRFIEKVHIHGCSDKLSSDVAFKILEEINMQKLRFSTFTFTEYARGRVLELIEQCKVENFELYAKQVIISDPANFLLKASTFVRSMHIHQHRALLSDYNDTYFLGANNVVVDWAPVIHEMFTRKLDKLKIENGWHPKYMSIHGFDMLREQLPMLSKKIWFKATCNEYASGLNYSRNDHNVQADAVDEDNESFLRIKHLSRADEKF